MNWNLVTLHSGTELYIGINWRSVLVTNISFLRYKMKEKELYRYICFHGCNLSFNTRNTIWPFLTPPDDSTICTLGCEQLHCYCLPFSTFTTTDDTGGFIQQRIKSLQLSSSEVLMTPVVLKHVLKYLADCLKIGKIGTTNQIFSIS